MIACDCNLQAEQANSGGDVTKRVYLVGDGAREEVDPYAPQTWMMGSETYLARTKVEPAPEVMTDGSQWCDLSHVAHLFSLSCSLLLSRSRSFLIRTSHSLPPREFAADGKWVDSVTDAKPIWSWPNRTGSTCITYIPPLKKFIMVVEAPGPIPQVCTVNEVSQLGVNILFLTKTHIDIHRRQDSLWEGHLTRTFSRRMPSLGRIA